MVIKKLSIEAIPSYFDPDGSLEVKFIVRDSTREIVNKQFIHRDDSNSLLEVLFQKMTAQLLRDIKDVS